jgi:hypothetical protein
MTQSRSRAAVRTVLRIAGDVLRLVSIAVRSHTQLAAENLFLRKQLALYVERQARPHRVDDATRIALVALSRLIEWRHLLIVVKPDTLIRWASEGFPAVLALEIKAARPAAIAGRPATADRRHGDGESHVG